MKTQYRDDNKCRYGCTRGCMPGECMVGGRGNNSISKAEGFLFCCLEVDDEGDDAVVVRKIRGLLSLHLGRMKCLRYRIGCHSQE
jgi:hypothetical protein